MSDQKEYECTVRIRNFSDENIHIPGSAAAVEMEAEEDLPRFLQVFANGMNAEDEGYVRLDFVDYMRFYCETSYVVSVLDASGNRRFPTSYVFCPERENSTVAADRIHPLTKDHAMKRDTLLEQPDEFLPEDCLTLHIHVITKRIISEDDIEESTTSFEIPSNRNEDVRLPLDSVLAKRLMGVSSYFRALSEAPMVERKRGYATFSRQEFPLFRKVCDILFGKTSISVLSVHHLLQISSMADKYDVPPVVESCRGMLSLVLSATENDRRIKDKVKKEIPKFLELAETLSDIRLKEIVESFVERNRGDCDEDNRTEESAADPLEPERRSHHVGDLFSYFTFANHTQKREEEFKFYQ